LNSHDQRLVGEREGRVGLSGSVALVSGASRGIGAGIAGALARAGADVAVNYVRNEEAARGVAEAIRHLGRRAEVFRADVSDEEACRAMVAEVETSLGGVDILVNNAGARNRDTGRPVLADAEPRWVRKLFEDHVMGPLFLCQAVLPGMRGRGRGSIVMISTIGTRSFRPNVGIYSIAKSGMEALAATLAKEEAQHGVRVNVVAPGAIDTASAVAPTAVVDVHPGPSTSDIGDAVAFLCSDAARKITGQWLAVDGGVGSQRPSWLAERPADSAADTAG
jgi:NAD(P)-dependent dehydrogenase (short-subunit alcohol dehydrogenase family)